MISNALLVTWLASIAVLGMPTAFGTSNDCVMSQWSEWTQCSKLCGGGSRSRTRSILSMPDGYQTGGLCPNTHVSQTCNTTACYWFSLKNSAWSSSSWKKAKETVEIVAGGKKQTFTFEKMHQTKRFGVNDPHVKLTFSNKYNGWKDVDFKWATNHMTGGTKCGSDTPSFGCGGIAPVYLDKADAWKCGTSEESSECEQVRKGSFAWKGSYEFSFWGSLSEIPTPTASPTPSPSPPPTANPSPSPTASPSPSPTRGPSFSPTASPSPAPTRSPSASPTYSPSASPTRSPTRSPTETESPSSAPTQSPTQSPTLLVPDYANAEFPRWKYMADGVSYNPDVFKWGTGNILSVDEAPADGERWTNMGAVGRDITGPATLYWQLQDELDGTHGVYVGLSSGTAADYVPEWNEIDCMLAMGSRQLNIVENGKRLIYNKQRDYDYAEDELALVINEDGSVTFYKNGENFGSCLGVLSFPVHIVASFSGAGSIDFGGLIVSESGTATN